MVKNKTKNYPIVRITGSNLNTFKSKLLKELSKQSVYSDDKNSIASFCLEENSKRQVTFKTLTSVEGHILTVTDTNKTVGRRVRFSFRKTEVIKNAKTVDLQIIHELSPIPTGTERGIVTLDIARGDNGSTILLINNKQFSFKK